MEESIQVNHKFIKFFNNYWPTNITHFLEDMWIKKHPNTIKGNDKKYNEPKTPTFFMKEAIASLALLER